MKLTKRWQHIFADLALSIAKASKDPTTKVGCVIYRVDMSVASMGFNGFPPGEDDNPELYADRDYKLAHTIHAEENAFKFLTAEDIYLIDELGLVCTFMPCSDCAKIIVDSGIKTVYYLKASKEAEERWAASFAKTKQLFKEAGIEAIEIEYE